MIVKTKENLDIITISENDLLTKILKVKGEYEPSVKAAARHVLEKNKKGICLDIGAHVGYFSLTMAKIYPEIFFKSFEPQKYIFNILNQNIENNKLKNIETYNVALGDLNEIKTLTVPDYQREVNTMAFSCDPEVRINKYEVKTFSHDEEIRFQKCDNYNFKEIALIKIDVEGFEDKVIKGMELTIEKNQNPPIIFETWLRKSFYKDRRNDLFKYVQSLGYKIHSFGDNNLAYTGNLI